MRVNRLFQIVNTIINRGTITAKELAEKFEVSTRTIYRDIDTEVKSITLKLKFAEEVLYQLYDYYDESNLIRNEDGSYTVHVTFPENEWIYSYVLSFGSDVEVIEPLYVRKEMIRRLSKNIEKYR